MVVKHGGKLSLHCRIGRSSWPWVCKPTQMRGMPASLITLDHLSVFRRHQRAHFLRRASAASPPLAVSSASFRGGVGQHRLDLRIEPLDDWGSVPLGASSPAQVRTSKPFDAGFLRGRHVRPASYAAGEVTARPRMAPLSTYWPASRTVVPTITGTSPASREVTVS